jgi:hypothetical protein
MKCRKIILGIVLIITTIIPACAQQYNAERDFTVITSDGGILITEYVGTAKAVNIPLRIQNLPVTSIAEGAFEKKNITSVTIPTSVTNISKDAFRYCKSLTSVTIPVGVTRIEEFTFLGCENLTSVTIPDSVISIGKMAFMMCTSLASINIPDSVTGISEEAFSGCTSLASIIIPNSVTGIGNEAFSACTNLKNITIGNGVKRIGVAAFYHCNNLTSVTFEGTISNFSPSPFPGDLLAKFYSTNKTNGTPGTYTRPNGGSDTWTKQ